LLRHTGAAASLRLVEQALRSSGSELDQATRALMESRFGHDFRNVRVHTDAAAHRSAAALQALAYTAGNHIVFAAGQYAPHSSAGRHMIAHELAHVVQQAQGLTAGRSGLDNGASDPLEQAAAQHADRVVRSAYAGSEQRAALRQAAPRFIQRYQVPGSLRCDEVVDWLNNSSPYAPEWAETRCNYSFNGGLRINTRTVDGGVEATVRGHNALTVTVSCPIDRPQWNPSARPNRDAEVAAFSNMRTALDAHEQQHRSIGQTWRATLESRFRGVNFTVTGTDRADAIAQVQAEVTSLQQQWMADAQAAQDAIDPFRGAILTCP
jgi:hypothetical protein